MAYKYCVATNWGKDFFTARERMEFNLSGHPGNVWVVGDNIYGDAWIKKVSGDVKTKSEAQAIVDTEITAAQSGYDALSADQQATRSRPTSITLK
jgi:hypothetical protein